MPRPQLFIPRGPPAIRKGSIIVIVSWYSTRLEPPSLYQGTLLLDDSNLVMCTCLSPPCFMFTPGVFPLLQL